MKQNQVNEDTNPTTETDGSPRPAPERFTLAVGCRNVHRILDEVYTHKHTTRCDESD